MVFAGIVSSAKKALGFPTEQKAYSLGDPAIAELFGALPTTPGVVVSSNSAMRVPAVLHAVRLISENVGSVPCKLYRETGDSKEAAKDHPAHKITHSRANEWTSAGQLRIDLTVDALLHGAGFAQVAGQDAAKEIAGTVTTALDKRNLQIEGGYCDHFRVTASRFPRDPDPAYGHGVLSVEALIRWTV